MSLVLPDRQTFETSLIERLLHSEKLTAPSVDRALRVRAETRDRLEAVLVNLGLASEQDIAEATASELGLLVARAADFPDEPILGTEISAKFLREACVLPLDLTNDGICLAMADPLDAYARRAIEMSVGRIVLPRVATRSDIQTAHERLFNGGNNQLGQLVQEIEDGDDSGTVEDVDRLRDLASEAPVIRLVNLLIVRAIESRASDIHVEPFDSRLLVRYRVDGILQMAAEPPVRLRAAVVSRIKIMARMNIAERRLPQDGRIRFAFRGRDLDLRVSTMPTLHGESVVMRILDRSSLVNDFCALGFLDETGRKLTETLARPQGIMLVTGPTGSGKTTSLYTALLRLNVPGSKLFTVEDPIEYELEGVNQIQVKGQIGLSFAQILRSVLRQDPDVIMIGEIRDRETAEVAVQAALTGHLVLSTLHTNDAAGSVTRLLDMGVADYLVTSTVNGVLAQRLVRRLCPHCREPYRALPEFARRIDADERTGETILYRAVGCEACRGSGYHGRTIVAEILAMTDPLRKLVLDGGDARTLRQAAIESGMRTMYADGVLKALAGVTSIEEVMRVTSE